MIHYEVAMPTPVPETAVPANSSVLKIAIAVVIAVAISAFFYFDLGRFLALQALKTSRSTADRIFGSASCATRSG